MNRAGYATAVAAKLFEIAHKAQAEGKTLDQNLYDRAKDLYLEALYRVIFIGAENSTGFHNPSEAGRICGDAVAMAAKAEALAAAGSGRGRGGTSLRTSIWKWRSISMIAATRN